MLPILLIHGYSSEGKTDNTIKNRDISKIYGQLPALLRDAMGSDRVRSLDLSRWISLSDGIGLDDISFAMDRAIKQMMPEVLDSGFHVLIHSTGALVVRHWLRYYSPKPSPIANIVHLAGANFGSGLAHIGRGELARWARFIQGTGRGARVLRELEFGCPETLDLQCHFLQKGNQMREDYQVQEFCLIGSQTFAGALKQVINIIPIRYVKEDSSDNTVRTAASNLNVNYLHVVPRPKALHSSAGALRQQLKRRENDETLNRDDYDYAELYLADDHPTVPFGILYETAHFGEDIGIVDGKKNRAAVIGAIKQALTTPYDESAYEARARRFNAMTEATQQRVSKLKRKRFGWNKQAQYEAHAQLIFRLRDQHGEPVPHYDITFRSDAPSRGKSKPERLERMIEDKHSNQLTPGIVTFYLRVQQFNPARRSQPWVNRLDSVADVDFEVTAYEPASDDISYLPLRMRLTQAELQQLIQAHRTTIVDIQLVRLPTERVFKVLRRR